MDEILGDSILDAWNNVAVRKSIGSVRGSEDDPTYFKYFELLARHLVQLKSERIGDQK